VRNPIKDWILKREYKETRAKTYPKLTDLRVRLAKYPQNQNLGLKPRWEEGEGVTTFGWRPEATILPLQTAIWPFGAEDLGPPGSRLQLQVASLLPFYFPCSKFSERQPNGFASGNEEMALGFGTSREEEKSSLLIG
jgi:hypothetical protein